MKFIISILIIMACCNSGENNPKEDINITTDEKLNTTPQCKLDISGIPKSFTKPCKNGETCPESLKCLANPFFTPKNPANLEPEYFCSKSCSNGNAGYHADCWGVNGAHCSDNNNGVCIKSWCD